MNLKDFITQTLLDITRGIDEAKNDPDLVRRVAPAGVGGHEYPKNKGVSFSARITSTIVEFDVAVTATSDESSSAGGGGNIVVFSVGATEVSGSSQTTVTRLKFSVPILLNES